MQQTEYEVKLKELEELHEKSVRKVWELYT